MLLISHVDYCVFFLFLALRYFVESSSLLYLVVSLLLVLLLCFCVFFQKCVITTMHWFPISVGLFCILAFHAENKPEYLTSWPDISTITNLPCHKIGEGQPRNIIYVNFVDLESLMVHAMFQDHRTFGLGEDF